MPDKPPRYRELSDYLTELGISPEDLRADPHRPPVVRIGQREYVSTEAAQLFEAWVRSRGYYARAGLPAPDLRPELLSARDAAA
jgi:hypothetical protein